MRPLGARPQAAGQRAGRACSAAADACWATSALLACLPPPSSLFLAARHLFLQQHDVDSEDEHSGSDSSVGNLAGLDAQPSASYASLDRLGSGAQEPLLVLAACCSYGMRLL